MNKRRVRIVYRRQFYFIICGTLQYSTVPGWCRPHPIESASLDRQHDLPLNLKLKLRIKALQIKCIRITKIMEHMKDDRHN